LFFECCNLAAESWLANSQPMCGSREIQFFRQNDHRTQMPDVELEDRNDIHDRTWNNPVRRANLVQTRSQVSANASSILLVTPPATGDLTFGGWCPNNGIE
jgi:hypothetical protein